MDYAICMKLLVGIASAAVLCMAYKSNQECQTDFLQCQTNFSISSVPQNDLTALCQSARTYLKCVEHIDCESEMFLRLSYKIVNKNVTDSNSHCEVGVPRDNRKYSTADCKNRVTACRDTYVNKIFVSDTMDSNRNETIICQDLDTFADCLLKISSCNSDREEVEKMIKDEKERMNLKDCETPSLNHGSKTATASVLLVTMATIIIKKLI